MQFLAACPSSLQLKHLPNFISRSISLVLSRKAELVVVVVVLVVRTRGAASCAQGWEIRAMQVDVELEFAGAWAAAGEFTIGCLLDPLFPLFLQFALRSAIQSWTSLLRLVSFSAYSILWHRRASCTRLVSFSSPVASLC